MKSRTTKRFWKAYAALPATTRKQARAAYELFLQNPYHPSLHFKRVHASKPVYSLRVNSDNRALGLVNADTIVWFWIGTHSAYDKLVTQLQQDY